MLHTLCRYLCALAILSMASQAHAGFLIGSAANYAVLVEPHLHNVQLTSDSGITGNLGVGSPVNSVGLSGGTIHGNVDFSAAQPSGGPNFGGTVTGTVSNTVAAVTSALTTMNSLNTTLGAEPGTTLVISGSGQVINASSGTIDGNGNEVFSVASNKFNNNSGGITINGTASQYVVINIANGNSNEKFNGAFSLSGGITSDHVLYNFVGTGGELGGAANQAIANGIFLAPNMKVNVDAVNLHGRLIGGGSASSNNDFQIVSNAFVTAPVSVPEPGSIVLAALGLIGLAAWRQRRKTTT
ncbi:MAG TPA: collagen-binding domain-containing protein [Pirellulales bacterium]|jgi:hypothetical protein